MQTSLNVQTRPDAGKGVARKLRRAGRLPGVLYGAGGETVPISMDAHEATRLFHSVPLESTVLELHVDGGPAQPAVVREVQSHPCRPEVLHVDFLRVAPESAAAGRSAG